MGIEPQPNSLLLLIDGREALPVRAISLVVDWDYLPPDALASALMHQLPPRHNKLGKLHAYHLVSGKPQRIEPWEWGSVVADLEAFEAKVRRRIPPNGQGGDDEAFQVWRELVIAKLPAAAFVWLTDFEREFAGGWAQRTQGVDDRPASPPASSYSPMNMTCFRDVVLEAFLDRSSTAEAPIVDDWTSPIPYEDLPHRIAKLRFPDDSTRYGACRLELKTEIDLAVVRGELTVRNALTGGPLAQPYPGAVVLVDDLRPFLATRGISILTQAPSKQERVLPEAPELSVDRSLGVDTAALARALDGIAGRDRLHWKTKLSDPPQWMKKARLSRGVRGKAAAMWDPICLLKMLVERQIVAEAEVKRLFRAGAVLESWRDEWAKRKSAFTMYGL